CVKVGAQGFGLSGVGAGVMLGHGGLHLTPASVVLGCGQGVQGIEWYTIRPDQALKSCLGFGADGRRDRNRP
ncbi:hypothetical protein, partial [Klebsiella pneumoniae]|uniref:hypothetical protein n=1 Tax=Klebsiella pneumoniae TaxID=573 RepID=UPI002730F853